MYETRKLSTCLLVSRRTPKEETHMKHSRIVKLVNIAFCLMALALGWIASMLQWVDTLGKGFVYAHAGIGVLILAGFLVLMALGQENALQRFGTWFIRSLRYVLAVTFTCLLAFVATKLVTVDFYVAYLLLAFGQCMVTVDFVGNTKGLEQRLHAFKKQRSVSNAARPRWSAKRPRFFGRGNQGSVQTNKNEDPAISTTSSVPVTPGAADADAAHSSDSTA